MSATIEISPGIGDGPSFREKPAERKDQVMADALVRVIATGRPETTPQLADVIRGYAAVRRDTPETDVANLRLMGLTCAIVRAKARQESRLALQLIETLEHALRDQMDHGQPVKHRLGLTGRTECLSVGYSRYRHLVYLALLLHPEIFGRELQRLARELYRQELTVYALMWDAPACARIYDEDDVEGTQDDGLRWIVAMLLRLVPPQKGSNWWERRPSWAARIWRDFGFETTAGLLFSEEERSSLRAWSLTGLLTPGMRALIEPIRLYWTLSIVRSRAGHAAWFRRLAGYTADRSQSQPAASHVGNKRKFVVVDGATMAQVEDDQVVVRALLLDDLKADIGRIPLPPGDRVRIDFSLERPPTLASTVSTDSPPDDPVVYPVDPPTSSRDLPDGWPGRGPLPTDYDESLRLVALRAQQGYINRDQRLALTHIRDAAIAALERTRQ